MINPVNGIKSITGVDSKAKATREENIRNIEAIMNTNVSNKEFQYFFAFTASEEDSIHCFGCGDKIFDANLAVGLTTKATRCMRNPEEFGRFLVNCIMGDEDDD